MDIIWGYMEPEIDTEKIKRKIWRTGYRNKEGAGSYIITLPQKVGQRIEEDSNGDVLISPINGSMIITPTSEFKKIRTGSVKSLPPDYTVLESLVVAAYLSGYDTIQINGKGAANRINKELSKICQKLPGAWSTIETGDIFKAVFRKIKRIDIDGYLNKCYKLCRDMFSINLDDIRQFSKLSLESNVKITRYETEIDRISYESKRALVSLTCYPERYDIIETRKLSDLFEYHRIVTGFERLSDIQREISDILRKLRTEEPAPLALMEGKINFKDYYHNAYKMVSEAYESKKNAKKAYKILRTKNDKRKGLGFRRNFITYHQRRELIKKCEDWATENNVDSLRDLTMLEQRIWAITGIATNIAESWRNTRKIGEEKS